VPEEGIEGAKIVQDRDVTPAISAENGTEEYASARTQVAFGPSNSTVEDALARAIEGAVGAQRWDIVAQLARELEARRLAAAGAVPLSVERDRRQR
jgi:hypothetical protein